MDPSQRSIARDAAFFIALLATSFALGGALAHEMIYLGIKLAAA